MTIAGRPHEAAGGSANRRGSLALALQEAVTVTVRLRTGRQIPNDAHSFRAHIKQLLATADDTARRAGYAAGDVKLAIYAVTVFIDESVLNLAQPMFADWPRQPLQEEIFGGHTGGETFFQNLRELLGRQDSEDLADLLEVYQLCLLLGLKGRYSLGDPGQLEAIMAVAGEKIQRVRGAVGSISPSGALPSGERIPAARDPWVRYLAFATLAAALLALVLFTVFRLSLGSGVSDLRALASQIAP